MALASQRLRWRLSILECALRLCIPQTCSIVGDSATSGNKIYACYIAEELSKIGRNPADFNRTFNVYLGARIYETATATDFITIPTAESSFDQGEPPAYDTGSSETGAFALFASGLAAIAVLFMAF